MDIENAKKQINLLTYIENYTGSQSKTVGSNTREINPCPICGHKDCFRIYTDSNSWNCFSGDHESGGSIVDFIIEAEHLDKREAINKVIKMAGGDPRENTERYTTSSQNHSDKKKDTTPKPINYSSLTEKFHKNIEETNYFQGRGIGQELVEKYKLGYDPKYHAATLPCFYQDKAVYLTKRLITPKEGQPKYYNEGKPIRIFNLELLSNEQKVVFITEGIFDALSIEKATGKPAIGLNSTSNIKQLLKELGRHRETIKENNKILIFIGDNDSAGEKAREKLKGQVHTAVLTREDPNEYLKNGNKEGLKKELKRIQGRIIGEDFNYNYLEQYFDELIDKKGSMISTGFDNMDKLLSGGFYSGLYVVGAISSLGKTTLYLQIADQIAQTGKDVLFFTLEQSKFEMTSKSLVRTMHLINSHKNISTMDLMQGDVKDRELLKQAIKIYSKTAKHIAFIQNTRKITDIRREIEKKIKLRESKPVIFVDYLQILEPPEEHMSYRQAVDFNLTELKLISRDYDIPVIVISSFNRDNYSNKVSFQSFKESGAIEYSADVVKGLQLVKMKDEKNPSEEQINKWKAEVPRKVELVLLKHRNGPCFGRATFKYNPIFNYFTEVGFDDK